MQKLQDSVFSIVKTTNLSPAVFNYLQPSVESPDKTPLGGILSDTKLGWLALGPKFCVVDLRTGLKVAARNFGASVSNFRTQVTSVVELPTPLTPNSQQLIISLECEDIAGMVCVFHINGSQILRCIQTEVVVTQLAVYDCVPDGPLTCFDGIVMAGTKSGEVFVFDLNRAGLIQALKDIAQGFEHVVRTEENCASLSFLPLHAVPQIEPQRELAVENDDHIAVLLNENSLVDDQYIFTNPDGTVRMKAKRNHIRVTVIQYVPQLGSLAVGFNFGAFQIWNLSSLDLEFTSQVNVECLPVTHFGFQEPCDDPRAFCYLWVVFSVIDRFDEEEFPLAVMYSLTYQGKRMLSDTNCLYQDFLTATVRFQVELSTTEEDSQLIGGRCVSCHTYSVNSTLGGEGEDSMLNLCQLIWECWDDTAHASTQHGMLLFDLDQWYKDQMPATHRLQSNTFMSATCCTELARGACSTLDVRLAARSVSVYVAPARLEEHFYPNSLHYECVCLNTSEACVLRTIGIQRQIINSMDEVGPTALLNPTRLYNACLVSGLVPLYVDSSRTSNQEEQRRYLLSVALESRLSRLLKRCAHDWATGSHGGAGCTLPFLVDWCWQRAIELKENARELTAPLFTSSALPDRNIVRCLEHCVQQLSQLAGLLDAILTKCCNLVVPDALNEMEEKHKAIGTVSLYFQVVQWFLRCGLLPERSEATTALPYPGVSLAHTYSKRRMKLQRLQENAPEDSAAKSCPLLYIDQLIEHEFGGERIHQIWVRGGSECHGLYPPPSLYTLLRLYLLPDVADEHKHSLVLYLLVDYSMVYDEVRYETVIRRLMQFPTMFGLSNTAIKATQAFWHLDHRDFDFALDQLQCLTGNTLSEWQHNVVLSSLLAQKKTQAALQYLHVRKPAPIQSLGRDDLNNSNNRVNDHDKLEDWQSCCNLYLARGLVFEALDVVRMCVQNAATLEDKVTVLSFFFKGCRNTGQLSKVLQVTLLPFEEEVFVKYLSSCSESQTSDILVMYYLQQARYLEAEQYNKKLKHSKPRTKDVTGSLESLADIIDRESARDTLVEVVCSSLPTITNTVAHCAFEKDFESHIMAAKPMSVFVQAKSPKNTFTYKSSFIQDTIENASETWMNRPRMRRGLKRALNIEETPFICTPKLSRSRSIYSLEATESTLPKRPKLDLSRTPKTPRPAAPKSDLSQQMSALLDMPEEPSPDSRYERGGAETPHSILKTRSGEAMFRGAPSPVDSRYLGTSDEELETASNNTHYSDSTNKHLRFTIPTASESGSTPSPDAPAAFSREKGMPLSTSRLGDREADTSLDSYSTTESHNMNDPNPMESPPKKVATEDNIKPKKSYKDTVKARHSLSMNSSLSDDPNTSIESIADIPITLINPRYSRERRYSPKRDLPQERADTESAQGGKGGNDSREKLRLEVPKTPKGRVRGVTGESTPRRSRSRTPEISPRSSPLEPIAEMPRQEGESEPHASSTRSLTRQLRSRSRTPERIEKIVESPRLEAISESPTKSESPASPKKRRSLRSRSRTPDIEVSEPEKEVPMTLRRRTKTPEKLMSPIKDSLKSSKKPLSRLVLEANAAKTIQKDKEPIEGDAAKAIECTPMKTLKQVPSLMDVTISPIASKSILQSSNESLAENAKDSKTDDSSVAGLGSKSLPAFTMNETRFGKSVLHSYESSVAGSSSSRVEDSKDKKTDGEKSKSKVDPKDFKSLQGFTLSESFFEKSVLRSYQSSMGEDSDKSMKADTKACSHITSLSKSIFQSYQKSLGIAFEDDDSNFSEPSTSRALSSLLTSDSSDLTDMYLKDKWTKTENAAAIIQQEKERVSDLERQINDFEGGLALEEEEDSQGEEDQEENSDQDMDSDAEGQVVEDESNEESDGRVDEPLVSDDDVISIASTNSDIQESGDENSDAMVADEGNSEDENPEDENPEDENREEENAEDENRVDVNSEDENPEEENAEEENAEDENRVDVNSEDENPEEENAEEENAEEENAEEENAEDENRVDVNSEDENPEEENAEVVDPEDDNPEDENPVDVNSEDENPEDENAEVRGPEDQDAEMGDPEVEDSEPEDSQESDSMPLTIDDRAADLYKLYHARSSIMQTQPIASEDKSTPIELESDSNSATQDGKRDNTGETTDPLNQAHLSIMTDDNSIKGDQSNINLSGKQEETQAVADVPEAMKTDLVQAAATAVEIDIFVEVTPTETAGKPMEVDTAKSDTQEKNTEDLESHDVLDTSAKFAQTIESDVEQKGGNKSSIKGSKGKTPPREVAPDIDVVQSPEQGTSDKSQIEGTPVKGKLGVRTRRRNSSASSNKSNKSGKESEAMDLTIKKDIEEPKTPKTRKRAKSNASEKSIESEQKAMKSQDTTEPITPSRQRAKTPTTPEGRRMVTRRASKELSGINESVDETFTPLRRSTRSRSKNVDDSVSIASSGSTRSNRSKASDLGEAKELKSAKKGRKSVVAAKPDLSVIPEVTAEESKIEDSRIQDKEEVMNEYSKSRRLTRRQKSLLESWLEPPARASPRRAASRTSADSHDDDDASSTSGFDAQSMDRIGLLNKADFEGSPDPSEIQSTVSPGSIASDASKQRRMRNTRAASESRTTPKAAKINRRISVDIGGSGTPEVGSPSVGSPARGRRASFNKACEALNTPKGRRLSTDVRGEAESFQGSPASDTPRRARRTSSHYSSATSASAPPGSGKSSKRTPSLDEDKDTKRKS